MSVNYKIVQKVNPRDLNAPKKFYGNVVLSGEKNLKQISKDIADISSLSEGDILNVLTNLILQLPKYLADGQNVRLGEFGNFRISISTEGTDTEDEFTAAQIKNAKIVFTPGVELKAAINNLKYTKV